MVAELLQWGFLLSLVWRSSFALLADEATPAPTLPEPVRQVAYMALLGIALLGMLMIVATLLGGHWVRRWGDRLRRPPVPPDLILRKQHASPLPEGPRNDPRSERNGKLHSHPDRGDRRSPEATSD